MYEGVSDSQGLAPSATMSILRELRLTSLWSLWASRDQCMSLDFTTATRATQTHTHGYTSQTANHSYPINSTQQPITTDPTLLNSQSAGMSELHFPSFLPKKCWAPIYPPSTNLSSSLKVLHSTIIFASPTTGLTGVSRGET